MKFLEWWLGDRRDPYTWLTLANILVIIALPAGPEWVVAFLVLVGTVIVRRYFPFDTGDRERRPSDHR